MAVLKMNFLSQALNMQTNVTVIMPTFSFADSMEGIGASYVPGMKYQVIYLLHGGMGDDSDYVNFTNIVRYADKHKLAVVMPAANNSSYTDYDGTDFYTYISEELPKLCETMFPISSQREDTFIGGLSMGSHGAMKIAMNHPERFAAVLLMSGASYRPGVPSVVKTVDGNFHFDVDITVPIKSSLQTKLDDPEYIRDTVNDVYSIARRNAGEGKKLPAVFFRVGDSDHALYRTIQAEKDLKEWGYDTRMEIVPGKGHDWDFWDESLRIAISDWLPLRHQVIYPQNEKTEENE
ncbi:alpha/beta hydrolase [Paenibacillus sp. YIM B09110]|uniref:alpha/beta hydrolase n=1 Tax=Paenibacillus sp. YIM B09110 TaxID=3126102 RepID=UPI00301CF8D1